MTTSNQFYWLFLKYKELWRQTYVLRGGKCLNVFLIVLKSPSFRRPCFWDPNAQVRPGQVQRKLNFSNFETPDHVEAENIFQVPYLSSMGDSNISFYQQNNMQMFSWKLWHCFAFLTYIFLLPSGLSLVFPSQNGHRSIVIQTWRQMTHQSSGENKGWEESVFQISWCPWPRLRLSCGRLIFIKNK